MTQPEAEALAREMATLTHEPYYICRRLANPAEFVPLRKASYLAVRGLSVYNGDTMVEPWGHCMRVI